MLHFEYCDYFTKYAVAVSLKDKKAISVAEELYKAGLSSHTLARCQGFFRFLCHMGFQTKLSLITEQNLRTKF